MKHLLFLFLYTLLMACGESEYTPRPRGYFRIDLPQKKYIATDLNCPFQFNIPEYSQLEPYKTDSTKQCWMNLEFSKFKSTLHISYFRISGKNELDKHIEDSRSLVYKHTIKAEGIDEIPIEQKSRKVYGLAYSIKGSAASAYQFYLTDSSNHFLRGALYFNVKPNPDSLAPVEQFIKKDIEELINSFQWK